jgi:hypothetical protein
MHEGPIETKYLSRRLHLLERSYRWLARLDSNARQTNRARFGFLSVEAALYSKYGTRIAPK